MTDRPPDPTGAPRPTGEIFPERGEPPAKARTHVPLGSIVLIVLGALIALASLAPVAGGAVVLWAYGTQRDDDGFFSTGTERFETTSAAITTEHLDLRSDRGSPADVGYFGDVTIRVRVRSMAEGPVFVGIAPQDDVDRFLSGVAHAELRDVRVQPFSASYDYVGGRSDATPPTRESMWVASATGSGPQTIDWPLRSGNWALVVMNADGSPGVSVDASAGAKAPWVLGAGIGILAAGIVFLAIGATMLVIGVVALARGTEIDLTAPPAEGEPVIALTGELHEPLNRGLWLVKWLLLIPHYLVLAVLWLAFSVVTLIAFFAILFTGRYPRSLFEFNAGVLRWSWRVAYYGYSALATDRYPPFSLGACPDYPATLRIAYPDRLSRGLVLVKWWLLAIPHYLVLGILTGSTVLVFRTAWATVSVPFGGLIGLLAMFAALALLFTGRYPEGIHELVMGLNRWVFRVVPYVALMRDEYPPFRLDQGPAEPRGARPETPTPPGPGAVTPEPREQLPV